MDYLHSSKLFLKTSSDLYDLHRSPCPLTNLVQTVYSVPTFLLLVPFKFTFNPTTGHHQVLNRKLFKLLVLGLHVSLGVLGIWMSIIRNIFRATGFMETFRILLIIPWFYCVLNLFRSLWTNQQSLETFLTQLDAIYHSMENLGVKMPNSKIIQALSGGLVLFYLTWGLIDIILFDLNLLNGSLEEQFLKVAEEAPTIFFMKKLAPNVTMAQLTKFQCAMTLMLMVTVWFTEYAIHLADLLFVTYALVNFILIHHFVQHLTSPSSKTLLNYQFNLVLDIFDQFRQLSDTMDDTIGSIIFCSCFCLLPYYSRQLLMLFQVGFLGSIQFYLYAITFGTSLILAAEANSKISGFITWLQQTQGERKFKEIQDKLNYHERLIVILSLVERNEIGLKGKSFTITYGFVGNMASLIITYAVVIVQLQSAAPK